MFNYLLIVCYLYLQINFSNGYKSIRYKSMEILNDVNNSSNPELIGGNYHECYRNCVKGENLTCQYIFLVRKYTSMSYACRNCPYKIDDCFRKGCVTAGGHTRPVAVANHMLPGPSIQVCEGDKIKVTVINGFTSDSVTIHWHGLHQVGTPFMDGAPFITQCPIPPHTEFHYEFLASPAGTHIWHSHSGFEEADGLYGSLIVRKANDTLEDYYDEDLAEHVMIIWHWYRTPTDFHLSTALHKYASVYGDFLLINGLASHVKSFDEFNNTFEVPKMIFNVDEGKRYRFRVIYNSPIYCPVQISIDNHELMMISSETGIFDPIIVDSFMINAGERYDLVLNANQKPGNYWIRYRAVGDCLKHHVKVSEVAILHYNSADHQQPNGSITYEDSYRSGVLLNPVGNLDENYENNTLIKVIELNNTDPELIEDISGTPNHTFYFKFSFNTYESLYAPGPYPQINDISFNFPSVPLLTQYNELDENMFCNNDNYTNRECISGFCTCPLIYNVEKDSLVEIVLVDESSDRWQDHPMHLHGHAFYVVAMESIGANISTDHIRQLNEDDLIDKKLYNAPLKDNINVPAKGFAIVRLFASNPGYWLFHCHLTNHMEMGMGFAIKVGQHSDMIRPPKTFPKCGNWHPNMDQVNDDCNSASSTVIQKTFSFIFLCVLGVVSPTLHQHIFLYK